MNWTNILETFIGALLAFMFGLLTQFLTRYFTEIKEKKNILKPFRHIFKIIKKALFLLVDKNNEEYNHLDSERPSRIGSNLTQSTMRGLS